MNDEQRIKLWYWVGFYVLLPLTTYPAAALLSYFMPIRFSLRMAVAKGDILFWVTMLLATTMSMTVIAFWKSPAKQMKPTEMNLFDHLCFIVMTILVVFYSMVYGWIITTRLPGGPDMSNPDFVMRFTALSALATVVFCSRQYYRLLRLRRA